MGAGLEARVWRLKARGSRARGSRFVRRSGLGARARVWTWARAWGSGLGLGARCSDLRARGFGLGARTAQARGWGLEACIRGLGSGIEAQGSGLGLGSGLGARAQGSDLEADPGWILTARDSRLADRGSGLKARAWGSRLRYKTLHGELFRKLGTKEIQIKSQCLHLGRPKTGAKMPEGGTQGPSTSIFGRGLDAGIAFSGLRSVQWRKRHNI